MTKDAKSILTEIDNLVPERNKHNIVEARASHVISSAINLIEMIKDNYGEEEANDLNRRLLLAIKNEDQNKFSRKVRQLKEQENKSQKKKDGKNAKS